MSPSASENPTLDPEERAQDLAISNSLILAPRHELMRMELELERKVEEKIGKPTGV
jgi:hypothetical protein